MNPALWCTPPRVFIMDLDLGSEADCATSIGEFPYRYALRGSVIVFKMNWFKVSR